MLVGLGLLIIPTLVFVARRGNANKNGGQQPAEPFRIAGNFYYVGAGDFSAFLITGPEGHVVLDAGYPTTARMIMASIAKLGFDIRDVKVLLNSEPHPDHGGGLAVLQQASGAQLWASDPSADSLAAGGDNPNAVLPLRALIWIGVLGYPPPRVDHRFKDGDTIRVGPIALHRAHHRRAYAWLHLLVVPRPGWRPRPERRERVRHRGARNFDVSGTSGRPRAQFPPAAEPSRRHLGDRPCTMVGPVPKVRREPGREEPG